jgi:transposase
MERHALSDREWELVREHLPRRAARTGRPPRDDRQMLEGILWVVRTGSPWRDLPEDRFGPWETVYSRFRAWQRDGTFARLAEALQGRLGARRLLDFSACSLDTTVIRAGKAAAGAPKGGIPRNRPIMPWAAAAAASGRSSTW